MIVVFEDNHQLVLSKPPGLLTQPSGTQQDSLEEQAKNWIKQKTGKPGNVFLHAVHRIDKPVSGIVLFAKTSKALARLQQFVREHSVKKQYLAIVEGHLKQKNGQWSHYLAHDEHKAVVTTPSKGKIATLSYSVIEEWEDRSLLLVTLDTGRYHQIRVQCAEMGFPIVGDHKYGSQAPCEANAIFLHHFRFEIPHPTTKIQQTFLTNPPPSWPIIKDLQNYS